MRVASFNTFWKNYNPQKFFSVTCWIYQFYNRCCCVSFWFSFGIFSKASQWKSENKKCHFFLRFGSSVSAYEISFLYILAMLWKEILKMNYKWFKILTAFLTFIDQAIFYVCLFCFVIIPFFGNWISKLHIFGVYVTPQLKIGLQIHTLQCWESFLIWVS